MMPPDDVTTASDGAPDMVTDDLRALAASLLEPVAELPMPVAEIPVEASVPSSAASPGGESEGLVLTLADVVGDGNNEVVFANEAGLSSLTLDAAEPVVAQGVAPAHVTAGGDDVGGFAYVTFAGGVTLYYPAELDLAMVCSA